MVASKMKLGKEPDPLLRNGTAMSSSGGRGRKKQQYNQSFAATAPLPDLSEGDALMTWMRGGPLQASFSVLRKELTPTPTLDLIYLFFQGWAATPRTLHRPPGLASREAHPRVITPPDDFDKIQKHLGAMPISM